MVPKKGAINPLPRPDPHPLTHPLPHPMSSRTHRCSSRTCFLILLNLLKNFFLTTRYLVRKNCFILIDITSLTNPYNHIKTNYKTLQFFAQINRIHTPCLMFHNSNSIVILWFLCSFHSNSAVWKKRVMDQPTDRQINQLTNQPTNQPTDRPTYLSLDALPNHN